MLNWIGVVVLVFGLYCFWVAIKLKFKKEIDATTLLGKDVQMKDCNDLDGYIQYMFPHVLIFAIVTTLCGIIDVLNSVVWVDQLRYIYLGSLVVFLVEFIVFARSVVKSKKRFFNL